MNPDWHRTVLAVHDRFTNRHILDRLNALDRSQWLKSDELLTLQRDKLCELVDYAFHYVPYYQRVFTDCRVHPQDLARDPEAWNRIPILTKPIIRKNWDALITTETERRRRLSRLNTSGSTGEPLFFMQDGEFQDFVTAETHHHMRWSGWEVGDLHAWIYISPTHPPLREYLRTGIADIAWNRYQLNASAMDLAAMERFARRLKQQETRLLWCCASSLHTFTRYIRTSPYHGIQLDAIFTTAEVLPDPVRLFIEETFNCRIYNRYGTMELGGVACECQEHSGLHISVENNFIEILNQGVPAQPEELGEFVITNLNNRAMPFIRYRIGDVGAWSAQKTCSCGRVAPKISTIDGRIAEMFLTRDGRYVRAGFSGGFSCLAHPTITQFQVIQKSLDCMLVRIVPDGKVPQSVRDKISHTIKETYGQTVVTVFEFVERIPTLPSGKRHYAMSEVNRETVSIARS